MYSLGNFAIPNGFFMKGKLSFLDRAMDEMVVENNDSDVSILHFKYGGESTISMLDDFSRMMLKRSSSTVKRKIMKNGLVNIK